MEEFDSRAPQSERLIPRRRLLRDAALATGGVVAATVIDGSSTIAAPGQRIPVWLQRLAQTGTPVPGTPMPGTAVAGTPEAVDAYAPLVLTESEIATLRAACNRLIPTDELGPGAGDAGGFIYIDWTLAGPGSAALPLYQGGLAALDSGAGGSFADADEATQDSTLHSAEAGELADAPEGFFALLLEQTRQGMFGDPMYGGNLNFAGWDLIQYPGLKLLWTAEEQELDVVIPAAHRSVAEQGGVPYGSAS